MQPNVIVVTTSGTKRWTWREIETAPHRAVGVVFAGVFRRLFAVHAFRHGRQRSMFQACGNGRSWPYSPVASRPVRHLPLLRTSLLLRGCLACPPRRLGADTGTGPNVRAAVVRRGHRNSQPHPASVGRASPGSTFTITVSTYGHRALLAWHPMPHMKCMRRIVQNSIPLRLTKQPCRARSARPAEGQIRG